MIAASVVIVSAAFGPFAQQAVRTTACLMPVSGINSTVHIAHFVDGRGDTKDTLDWHRGLSRSLRSALVNALVAADNGTSKLPVECPTGTCSFNKEGEVSYASSGICHQCHDVTSFVQQHSEEIDEDEFKLYGPTIVVEGMADEHNISMSNKVWSRMMSESIDSEISLLNVSYLTYTHAPCSVNNMDQLSLEDIEDGSASYNWTCPKSAYPNIPDMVGDIGVLAVNCTFYPCLRQYHSRVDNGLLKETVLSDTVMASSHKLGQWGEDFHALLQPCFIDGQWYDVSNISQVPQRAERQWTNVSMGDSLVEAPGDCVYAIDTLILDRLFTFFQDSLLTGECKRVKDVGLGSILGNRSVVYSDDKYWQEEVYNFGFASFDSVDTLLGNVALVSTNMMRAMGKGIDKETPEFAEGTVWETTVCTQVDWRWLALPATVESLTLLLLLAILVYDWRGSRPVWKSSVLPLLFHGLRGKVDENGEPLQLGQMRQTADEMQVRLVTHEGTSGFLVTGELSVKRVTGRV